jgi:hypothetical protein
MTACNRWALWGRRPAKFSGLNGFKLKAILADFAGKRENLMIFSGHFENAN